MNRILIGALAALLLAAAGIFWWQGRAELARGLPPPDISGSAAPGNDADALPEAGAHGRGAALPSAGDSRRHSPLSSEDRSFNRYDKHHDGRFTRTEMMATRVKAFQKLDVNHDNLLSFEEWAVKTSDKFKEMDSNHDGIVTRAEFHAWYVVHHKPRKPTCACPTPRPAAGAEDGDEGEAPH